jgi:excisionase family DNA binding protein
MIVLSVAQFRTQSQYMDMDTNTKQSNRDVSQSTFLSPAEVAREIRVSRSKVYELIRAGILPCRRFGMSIRVPRAAIEQMAAELIER